MRLAFLTAGTCSMGLIPAGTIAATQIITGPGTVDTTTFTAPTQAGSYFFWCDVHTTIMTGDLVVGDVQ